jgi:hypothetical protein
MFYIFFPLRLNRMGIKQKTAISVAERQNPVDGGGDSSWVSSTVGEASDAWALAGAWGASVGGGWVPFTG